MTGPPRPTRLFLVGCPRSGTTLLQSLLLAHPDVVSFPETFIFARLVPNASERVRRRLGVASAEATRGLRELDALGLPPDPVPPRWPSVTVGSGARRFVRRMDRAAGEAGATLWLEKTPSHAKHIERITREVPDARFVHLVRAGEAVAASLKDASDVAPEVWSSATGLQFAQMWRRYLGYSERCVGQRGHVFVSYERLVADTQAMLADLCAVLDLRADRPALTAMLDGYGASSNSVIGRLERSAVAATTITDEAWKADVGGAIVNRNGTKFERLFGIDEQAEIRAVVADADAVVRRMPFL